MSLGEDVSISIFLKELVSTLQVSFLDQDVSYQSANTFS